MPVLELIDQRASRAGVPVDSRIERGRSPRHALARLIEHERFDTLVVPARTSTSDGFDARGRRLAARERARRGAGAAAGAGARAGAQGATPVSRGHLTA